MNKALLKAKHPSIFFETLRAMDKLQDWFGELHALIGVEQDPIHHPEGDVWTHTMLVLDAAAQMREQAAYPAGFMLSALCHDLGKFDSTEVNEEGRIISYLHPVTGVPLAERQLGRLTSNVKLTKYVANMVAMHMRPNALANAHSKKKKTRIMFDLAVCPEDLILLSRADATGKLDGPYNEANWNFLMERLEDYRQVMQRPMVTGQDLLDAGFKPGEQFKDLLARAKDLHFSGVEKGRVLRQLMGDAGMNVKKQKKDEDNK